MYVGVAVDWAHNMFIHSHHHYTFVRLCIRAYEREVTGSRSTLAKKFLFLGIAGLRRYNRWPTDMASDGPSRDWSKLLQKDGWAELDWSALTNAVARWTQKSDILESMLSTGGFHKEAILF